MAPYLLPLALLFIAFTAPSIAQKTAAAAAAAAAEADAVPTLVEVAAGAPLSVECVLGVQQRAAWRADGAAPAPDLQPAGERALPGPDGRLVTRLHAARARPAHAALYTCAPHATPVRVRVLTLPGAGASASPGAGAGAGAGAGDDVTSTVEPKLDTSFLTEHLVNFELGKRLEFDCKLEHDVTTPNYLWYKNGYRMMEVDAAPARGPVTEREGRVLVFRRAHEDDYGNYSCAVGGAAAAAWDARAQPVARLPPNTNVVEGQNFSITCKLIGKPYLPVEWLFTAADGTNATVQGTADGRVAVRDAAATGVPRGLLAVAAATAADAGQYTCVPYNGTAAASTVRVKDVYAALWPFLGICLEVFVLCAIILVYEKRRTKPELDDSDADTHDQ